MYRICPTLQLNQQINSEYSVIQIKKKRQDQTQEKASMNSPFVHKHYNHMTDKKGDNKSDNSLAEGK